MTDRPRVLVVGAGAAGMMAAIAAAQTLQAAGEPDGGVLLLERGDRPCRNADQQRALNHGDVESMARVQMVQRGLRALLHS